jgi:hypothetical protein
VVSESSVWPHWSKVKLLLCILGGIGAAGLPVDAFSNIVWVELPLIFAAASVAVLLVVGLQAINPLSAPRWHRPTWASRPFSLGDPLAFFHFGGWYFMAGAIGLLISTLCTHSRGLVGPLSLACVGLGIIAGVRLCGVAWRWKFSQGNMQPGRHDGAA